ncbi:IclR family transcriptional regulator [Pseudorhodoferax sp.]|uniref:IclR family transcriptional regulator n=1 Tax=Pseudorhodoferax sp. TaxID=1993553 RepID=UPI002DD6719C|nr:helix-turn-helix domain-containing protein [Pseudorhodoferax sp.]
MADGAQKKPAKKTTAQRRGVQSIAVGATLLEALAAAAGPMQLREVAAGARMTPQKAHRYLLTLVAAGLAEQDPVSGRYDLGGMSLRLGVAALSRQSGLRLVTQAALEFGRAEDVMVGVAVWGTHGPTFIAWQNASLATPCNFGVGTTVRLLRSATGQLFLAHVPRKLTHGLVDRELSAIAAYAPDEKVRTWDDVERLVARVQAEGVGLTHEDLIPGSSAVAAPVFDHQGEIIAAICQMGPTRQIHSTTQPASRRLLELARQLSRRMGFDPDQPFLGGRPHGAVPAQAAASGA